LSDCTLDTSRFQAKGRRVATEAQPAKQTKLLVVEDDAMIGMLLADMLDELGYTVPSPPRPRASMRR